MSIVKNWTFLSPAHIIILHKLSAVLDMKTKDNIFKNFEHISNVKTAIMISQRISNIHMSAIVIVLDDRE